MVIIVEFVKIKPKVDFKCYFSLKVNYFFIPLKFSNYHHIALKICPHSSFIHYRYYFSTITH